MITQASARWTRLDAPGEDQCRLILDGADWRLLGEARYDEGRGECRLGYDVLCDAAWHTRSATIEGEMTGRPITIRIERQGDEWSLNAIHQLQVTGLIDIDLSFTPATNILPIRRCTPIHGQTIETVAAWLTPDFRLAPLHQTYTREAADIWVYAATNHGFTARLRVHPTGLVINYPGLWTGEVAVG